MKFAFVLFTTLVIALLTLVLWLARLSLFAAAIATYFFGYQPDARLIHTAILIAACGVFSPASVTAPAAAPEKK